MYFTSLSLVIKTNIHSDWEYFSTLKIYSRHICTTLQKLTYVLCKFWSFFMLCRNTYFLKYAITTCICAPQNNQYIISKIHFKKTHHDKTFLPLFEKEGEKHSINIFQAKSKFSLHKLGTNLSHARQEIHSYLVLLEQHIILLHKAVFDRSETLSVA